MHYLLAMCSVLIMEYLVLLLEMTGSLRLAFVYILSLDFELFDRFHVVT